MSRCELCGIDRGLPVTKTLNPDPLDRTWPVTYTYRPAMAVYEFPGPINIDLPNGKTVIGRHPQAKKYCRMHWEMMNEINED